MPHWSFTLTAQQLARGFAAANTWSGRGWWIEWEGTRKGLRNTCVRAMGGDESIYTPTRAEHVDCLARLGYVIGKDDLRLSRLPE